MFVILIGIKPILIAVQYAGVGWELTACGCLMTELFVW